MSEHFSNSAPPQAGNPAPPSDSNLSRALATVSPAAGLPMTPFGADFGSPKQDVINGGVDPASLFHSFRRRWLLSVCMGLLVGAIAGATLFVLFPESSSAVQLFQVSSSTQSIMESGLAEETSFEIFRNTQAVKILSQFVLSRAISAEGVSQTSFFKDVPPEEQWQHLANELTVSFPKGAEVMAVSLSGSAPTNELRLIVEAVGDAYEQEVLVEAKIDRLRPREILIESGNKIEQEIVGKMQTLEGILEEQGGFGSLEGGQVDPESRLLISEATALQKSIAEAEEELIDLQSGFSRSRKLLQDPELLEQRIDEVIDAEAEVQYLESEILFLKTQLRDLSQNSQGRSAQAALRPIQERYQFLNSELAILKKNTKKQMLKEHERKPNTELRLLTDDFRQNTALLRQQIAKAQARIAEITETLRERGATDVDIIMRRNEIDGLRDVASTIALRVNQWDVEAEADARIKKISIETKAGINTTTRYGISAAGGLACFALTCFGIAYMEFRNRRLNGPEQVDEGLGIRVIGTLPALSARKALDRRHPVVAQLTESIDSVRTALMHESTRNRRQIVMVTSAAAMEGRTTVASQLAASLARAGRRTLLIDGDLRRPALHNLFDVPLEDGLCEVLRAETDVADVIRPTHAEGLWLITAGYCDADAVHALATDQVQPIFEKLRSEYDFIIIDGAPVLGLSDSLLFGQHCDGAILSVLRDHTSVPNIHKSAQLLESVGIRLIGSVVNGVVSKADRRVTHLQAVTPKSEQKQLEESPA